MCASVCAGVHAKDAYPRARTPGLERGYTATFCAQRTPRRAAHNTRTHTRERAHTHTHVHAMENTLALDRQVELRSACGGSVRVIGTSHLSSTSAATVLSVVSSLKPESVACELDVHRAVMTGLLSSVEEADGRNPRILAPYFDAKHTWPGTMALLFALMMSGPTAMLTPLVDEFPYGADQAAAVRSAADCGASVAFVDRNQSVTLARVAAKLTLLDVLNAMPAFIGGISSPPNVKTPTPLLCKLMWQCMWRNFGGIADTLDEVVADNAAKDVIFSASSAVARPWRMTFMTAELKSWNVRPAEE
ncbi:hypothetical protein EON67_12250, partial [archaeon]